MSPSGRLFMNVKSYVQPVTIVPNRLLHIEFLNKRARNDILMRFPGDFKEIGYEES